MRGNHPDQDRGSTVWAKKKLPIDLAGERAAQILLTHLGQAIHNPRVHPFFHYLFLFFMLLLVFFLLFSLPFIEPFLPSLNHWLIVNHCVLIPLLIPSLLFLLFLSIPSFLLPSFSRVSILFLLPPFLFFFPSSLFLSLLFVPAFFFHYFRSNLSYIIYHYYLTWMSFVIRFFIVLFARLFIFLPCHLSFIPT